MYVCIQTFLPQFHFFNCLCLSFSLSLYDLFLLILCTVCPILSLPLIAGFSSLSLIWEAAFPFIPIFSDETMLLLQILSFGGLLKCGLISEWGGGGAGGWWWCWITIQKYHNIFTHCCLTIAGGNDTTAYTVDYIRFKIGLMFCSDTEAFILNK